MDCVSTRVRWRRCAWWRCAWWERARGAVCASGGDLDADDAPLQEWGEAREELLLIPRLSGVGADSDAQVGRGAATRARLNRAEGPDRQTRLPVTAESLTMSGGIGPCAPAARDALAWVRVRVWVMGER